MRLSGDRCAAASGLAGDEDRDGVGEGEIDLDAAVAAAAAAVSVLFGSPTPGLDDRLLLLLLPRLLFSLFSSDGDADRLLERARDLDLDLDRDPDLLLLLDLDLDRLLLLAVFGLCERLSCEAAPPPLVDAAVAPCEAGLSVRATLAPFSVLLFFSLVGRFREIMSFLDMPGNKEAFLPLALAEFAALFACLDAASSRFSLMFSDVSELIFF